VLNTALSNFCTTSYLKYLVQKKSKELEWLGPPCSINDGTVVRRIHIDETFTHMHC